MKLKFKITLICIAAIFIAVVISDVIIISYCTNKVYEKTESSCKLKFDDVTKMYRLENDKTSVVADSNIYANMYFKRLQNDYVVCIDTMTGEEIYNHTVFSGEELMELCDVEAIHETEYEETGNYESSYGFARIKWKSRDIIIYGKGLGRLNIYHIFDITYIRQEIHRVISIMIILSLIVISVVVILVWVLLKREFRPLQQLSDSTKKIAGGNYGERVVIAKADEIGELGQQFNVMADAIEEKIDKLLEEERKKNVFMGNLTHELRTPLTAIYGYAQTMRAVKLSEEEEKKALEYVEKESLRLSRLSDKMLQLMGLKEGGSIEKRQIKIKSIINDSINACSKYIEAKNITVEVSVADESLIGDRDLMTEVLINLLSNAIRATGENGKIKLYVNKDNKEIVVEDEGMGMEKTEVDKILEPFYRIDKGRSRKEGGAGLGLSLVKEILLKHNMELKIESSLGVGTKMIIIYE